MARHAVLIKVVVQTVWAEIDTESGMAIEHVDPMLPVPANEWPSFFEKWSYDWAVIREAVAQADVDKDRAKTNGHQG